MLASSPGLDSCFIIYKSWERRGRRGFRHEFPLQEKNYKWVDQYQEYVSLSRDLHSFHLTSDQVFTFDASQAYSSSPSSWSSKSSYSVNLYLCWISKEYRLGKASKIEKEKSKKNRDGVISRVFTSQLKPWIRRYCIYQWIERRE